MRTKGKPSCGGTGCDPCNADGNPCFTMVTDGPVNYPLDSAPLGDGTWGATVSFAPEDLPRDRMYRCLWNPATSEYDCQLFTPGAGDAVETVEPLTISDRYEGDDTYRSENQSDVNNLCEGKRYYSGAYTTPDPPCAFLEVDGSSASVCNRGVIPGHVGDMTTGPWTSTWGGFLEWTRVNVGGVLKIRIKVYNASTANDGWWGETDFYRAGSTPTAPIFWWPIPSGSPIRLAYTPTITADGSEPLEDPGTPAEVATFNPWPDLLLTSCDNAVTCPEIDPAWPECLMDLATCEMKDLNYHIEYDDGVTAEIFGTFTWADGLYNNPGQSPTMNITVDEFGGPYLFVDDIGYDNEISGYLMSGEMSCIDGEVYFSTTFEVFAPGGIAVHVTVTIWSGP